MSVKVVDLVGGPRGLAVEVVASLPSEMLAGILKYGMPESIDTFDVGREWFETVRARMSPELLALLAEAPELGGPIGYALEEPRPKDVPAFIARLESLPQEDLWLALAGYHFPPFRRRLGDEVFHRALDRDPEAGERRRPGSSASGQSRRRRSPSRFWSAGTGRCSGRRNRRRWRPSSGMPKRSA
jgi:hypothetical protein